MLDIKRIKEDPNAVKAGLKAKEVDCDELIDRILELDQQRRSIIAANEARKAEQNKVSKEIPMKKKAGEDVAPIFARMAELKAQIAADDETLRTVEAEYRVKMLSLPNLPDPDLKPGGKENNEPLRYYGEPHKFDFTPKHHVDLCTDLGLIDYKRGAKLAGTGFWIYKGPLQLRAQAEEVRFQRLRGGQAELRQARALRGEGRFQLRPCRLLREIRAGGGLRQRAADGERNAQSAQFFAVP